MNKEPYFTKDCIYHNPDSSNRPHLQDPRVHHHIHPTQPTPIMTITNKQFLYIITLFSDKRFQSGSIEQLGHHKYHTWGLDGIGVLKLASNVGRIEINSVWIQIRDIYIDQFAQNYYQESQSRCSYSCNNCLWSSSTSEDLLIQCNCSYYSSS